jgi:hypothetical protein
LSTPNEPSDASKPVVKDKNPHNYRKVGYSMIVISVSLVLIGLLILFIGNNYHFSGDIMAKQEIDSMTSKSGYDIVAFDYTQPIGAKLQLLDHASNLEDAKKLKDQHTPYYNGQKGQVLIFDTSIANNTQSISLAEVYAMTPTSGYDVVSFNTMMPVGARLSPQTLDALLGAAVNDSARYSSANVDTQIQILTFTSSFDDNLRQVLGSKYDPMMASENINQIKLMPSKMIPPPPAPVVLPPVTNTTPVTQNTTQVATPINATVVTHVLNSTMSGKPTGTNTENMGIGENVTILHSSNLSINATTSNHTKTKSLSESVGIKTP